MTTSESTVTHEPALTKAKMIEWGKKLYAEAQGVDRIQLEEVVVAILGDKP
jgi:hypothetical protein